jgi:hypothetical protein
MLPRIFVVGTGRSGTWILYRALGSHPAVHTFPREMRFLTDPDGLLDLLDALTTRYHPVQASEALYRFERLMRVYLANPERAPYRGFDFPSWLGGAYYWERLDQFCSELVDFEYEGKAWQLEPEHEGRLVAYARRLQGLQRKVVGKRFSRYRLSLPRPRLKVVKHFSDRDELASSCAALVDALFCRAVHEHGKETWCEKTPQHLLNLDFIWELFPQSIVIHIKRDPRGVVHSLVKQPWAPNDVRGASLWLHHVYNRWFDLKSRLDLSPQRYFELKLEDLAASPRATLEEVAAFCDLDDRFVNLPTILPERVNYWQQEMSQEDIYLVNRTLGSYINRLGYDD